MKLTSLQKLDYLYVHPNVYLHVGECLLTFSKPDISYVSLRLHS